MYCHVWTWYKSESDDRLAGCGLKCFSLEMCSNSDVREFHAQMKMRSMSLRFFDQLQSSSIALRNSISANNVHVTMEIYIYRHCNLLSLTIKQLVLVACTF